MKPTDKKIILTGGKTGGHIYPALAIADMLRVAYEVHPYYIGAKDGMEKKILAEEDIPFFGIDFAPMVGIPPLKRVTGMLWNLVGFVKSLVVIQGIRPVLIIGTGGYVAGPVLAAAFLLGVPIIIHEQNVSPGVTNKILSHIAKEIWMTFNESAAYFPKGKRKILTGMPLRKNLQGVSREEGRSHFGFSPSDKVLLVTGGSQGSAIINDTIKSIYVPIIQELGYKIIHATGPTYHDKIMKGLRDEERKLLEEGKLIIRDYLMEMDLALHAADVTICRSGASFICELIATNSYSIQIPMKASAGNHQLKNAKAIEKTGLGRIIEEDELTGATLLLALKSLQPGENRGIMNNHVGILFGENTKEIIIKEAGKYLDV